MKSNLASLKNEVDKIDAGKLKTVPVDLDKLSNVVKNDVLKNTEYDKLVAEVMVLIIKILSQGPSTKKMGQNLKIKSIR